MYVHTYVCKSDSTSCARVASSAGSVGHSVTATTCSVSFIWQDHTWVKLTDGTGKASCWDSGRKMHCTAYALLPHSCLPHNILHSPIILLMMY